VFPVSKARRDLNFTVPRANQGDLRVSQQPRRYAFLFLELIPVCITVGYLFLLYGARSGINSTAYLGLGFFGVAGTYAAWAPWHLSTFYYVWFFLFLLALVPILAGFLLLSKDVEIRRLRGEIGDK
ncbi:MAG: hypothetical protein ACTSU5_02710, partial [Promethearchaeota archaeon]